MINVKLLQPDDMLVIKPKMFVAMFLTTHFT